jgi:hypothetical protein
MGAMDGNLRGEAGRNLEPPTLQPVFLQPATQGGRHAGAFRRSHPGWTALGRPPQRLAGRPSPDLRAGPFLPGDRPGRRVCDRAQGLLLGVFSFAAFFLLPAIGLSRFGIGLTFLIATGTVLVIQGLTLRAIRGKGAGTSA